MTVYGNSTYVCMLPFVYCPQTWQNNMSKTFDPKIKFFDGEDFTCVTFQPDLAKFKMEKLDKDIVALLTRRAYDIAGSCKGVKVTLNGKKLPVSLSVLMSLNFFISECVFEVSTTVLYSMPKYIIKPNLFSVLSVTKGEWVPQLCGSVCEGQTGWDWCGA